MDPFEQLGVERRFDLDLGALEKTHRELSRALHPDRYAQAGASERRASLEKAASVNEAWRTLRDPIRRAEALFRLAGAPVGEDKEPRAAPELLMRILEAREELAEARGAGDLAKVRALGDDAAKRAAETERKLAAGFASLATRGDVGAPPADPSATAALVPLLGELRFYRRLLDEVSAIEEDAELGAVDSRSGVEEGRVQT